MADLLQRVRYPGIIGVQSLQYTCSHGASPGKVFLNTNPQTNLPAGYGTLAFDDGVRGIALKNCRVLSMEWRKSSKGKYLFVVLEDERWMWRNAPVFASFNKLQPNGKLSPFTIASPTEIAVYLLGLAGVRNYRLVLPAGLPSSIRTRAKDYLKPGQNLPMTRTNPPCVWDGVPALQALTEFAARFGCRLIYQPIAGGRLLVAPIGGSWAVPKAGLMDSGEGIESPALPKAVHLYGAESLHQVRVPMEPVAEEYDETYSHIFEVSYAPTVLTRLLVIEGTSTHPASSQHRCEFKLPDPKSPADESKTSWFLIVGTSLANLASLIATDSRLRDHVATVQVVGGNTIRLTGKQDRTFGATFKLSGPGLPPQAKCATKIAAAPGMKKPGWGYCPPPTFPTVLATDRLNRDEAQGLARKTVWKCFRPANCAPHLLAKLQEARREKDPKKWPKLAPLTVPGFGPLQLRQQLIPTRDMVERLEPTARQLGGIQVGNTFAALGQTILPDFYNGTNTAKPAVVRGQYANMVGSVFWTVNNANGQKAVNSPPNKRVYVGWNIDPINQLIVFGDYIYKFLPIGNSLIYEDPDLIYEGACYVLDPKANVPIRYKQSLAIPGGFAPAVGEVFDDVVVSWVGKYDENNRLTKSVRTDFGDGFRRAKDYLAGMLKPYQLKATGLFTYLGIRKIDPDGAVQQVTWKLSTDEPGPQTIVSLNSETSTVIPPWGPRQLQENLPPNRINKLLNAAENPSGLLGAIKGAAKSNLPFGLGRLID